MAKLTKQQIKNYDKAMALLEKGMITDDEKLFIFEHYREDAVHLNSKAGAFFTPYGLARDLKLHLPWQYQDTIDVVDLCAGIGILSYVISGHPCSWNKEYVNLTCVEINPDYVEIGKKLVPEANWICGDALDPELLNGLGKFDCAVANPPYGHYKTPFREQYQSGFFEYMIIEAASKIARNGVFLIPQMAAPFIYSGTPNHRHCGDGCRARQFSRKTGIELEFGVGVDTEDYLNGWHGVSMVCEIVCCEFNEKREDFPLPIIEATQTGEGYENDKRQLSLWDIAI